MKFINDLKLRRLLAASFALLFLNIVPAFAADYFDLPPEELLKTQVTSVSKRPELLSEAQSAVYVITRDDILRSGVRTIPDALRMAPGVNVAQQDSNSWAVSIRGFNNTLANKLLVMIDGRTVYNPAFAGTFWEIQDVVLADIDRIEVIRGPGGTLWGANAVNGVVNIITRDARDTVGEYVKAGYGNVEQGFISARHGATLRNGGAWRVYAKAFNRDSFDRPNGSDNHDDWRGLRSGFRADWDTFTVQGDVYGIDAHERNTVPNFTPPDFGTEIVNELEYRGGNLLGRWKHDTANGGLLTLQSYVDYAARLWPQAIDDRRFTFDFEPQYNFPITGRHEFVVGGDYRFLTMNESSSAVFAITPEQDSFNLFSAFIQDKIMLAQEWFLTLGTKVEHNDFSGFEVQPNARIAWTPDNEQTAWAAVSRAVRTPTPIEQNATVVLQNGLGTQFALVPNPNFDSEDLIAYEAGYRRQITPDLSVDVAAFLNDYSNLANSHLGTPVPINNGVDPPFLLLPGQLTNDMTGETWGFEVSADWRVLPNWKLQGTYSYLEIYLHSHDNTLPDQEAAERGTPRNQFSIRSNWKVSEDWSLDTSLYHASELNGGSIPSHTRLDANLGYRVNDNLNLNLVGQNLFNNDHREISGGAEIPTSVFGYVTWHF